METVQENTLNNQLHTILQQTFGFQTFRPGQLEALTNLLTRGRLLCIQPTGHGKSLLYQLPSCLLSGITVVISPLLALMRDQIDHLNHRFRIPAVAINSDQSGEENDVACQLISQGHAKVLFIAPEQLDHVDKVSFFLSLDICLIVVDEAHCISTWGHDFRPNYRQIIEFVRALNEKKHDIKILGLTATANKRVEEDIVQQLCLSGQEVIVMRENMDRPNLILSVIPANGIAYKLAACEELVNKLDGCGLIYCATRENTEVVAEFLRHRGIAVTAYHAGMDVGDKRRLQKEFVADKYKVLVATNALGMGIDKGNLRFIIHFDFPGSITAYYQEVGRCGRDGDKAEGIMLYDPADRSIQEYFIQSALPNPEDFQSVLNAVAAAVTPPTLIVIRRLTGLHPTRVTIVIAELLEQGFLSKYSLSGSQVYKTLKKFGKPNLARYANQQKVKKQELQQILDYGKEIKKCRMAVLRTALGDLLAGRCGHCDVCHGRAAATLVPIPADKLASTSQWLDSRPVTIAAAATNKISGGVSILDGKMRSPLFLQFMRQRAKAVEIDEELLALIKKHITALAKQHTIIAIIPIPSRTWQGRESLALQLATHLGVPAYCDLLAWDNLPNKRQGELLNNDQRHHNVHQHMKVHPQQALGAGTLLLLDDYIGSGNTIREAARALRATKRIFQPLVPFTVAAVKWQLGRTGYT